MSTTTPPTATATGGAPATTTTQSSGIVVHQLDERHLDGVTAPRIESVDSRVTAGAARVPRPVLVHQLALDLAVLDVARDQGRECRSPPRAVVISFSTKGCRFLAFVMAVLMRPSHVMMVRPRHRPQPPHTVSMQYGRS